MPRFVILEHDHPHLHWDIMLETPDALETWRLAAPPVETGAEIEATALDDHRKAYLAYEGPVSGNRGTVRRWDAGTFTEETDSQPDMRRLHLHGTRIDRRVRLERVEGLRWRLMA